MNSYFIETDEFCFLHSFREEKLPNNHPFSNLEPSDVIIFLVERQIAGVAKTLQEDGTITFEHVFEKENRIPLLGMIWNILLHEWGNKIDESLSAYAPVPMRTGKHILEFIEKTPSSLGFFITNIDFLYEEAKIDYEKNKKKREKQKVEKKLNSLIKKESVEHDSEHSKAQFYLKEIAGITNCNVWTAQNDKNRTYKGNRLGEDDVEHFPNFHLDEEVKKRICLIDTIWFKGEFPVSCFEVETSTSVFSGLLRMADLLSVMPNTQLKLYIVAPNARRDKVMREMNRPIFRAIGLHKISRFVSIESLEILYQKIKGLDGYVDPHVIESIALDVSEMEHLAL